MSKSREKALVKLKTQADGRRAGRHDLAGGRLPSPEMQLAERRDYGMNHRGQVIISPHP